MKKTVLTLAIVSLILSMLTLSAAAFTAPVGEVSVPYAVTVPTMDGKMSDGEWSSAAKVVCNNDNMMAVGFDGFITDLGTDYSTDLYFMWDETYLYFFFTAKDPTPMRYVNGAGDYCHLYLDLNKVATTTATPDVNPVDIAMAARSSDSKGAADGKLFWLMGHSDFDADPDAGAAYAEANSTTWSFEGRMAWTAIQEITATNNGATADKTAIAAGSRIGAAFTYTTRNNNNADDGWFITLKDICSLTPTYYGMELVLAEKPAEQPDQNPDQTPDQTPDETPDDTPEKNPATGDSLPLVMLSAVTVLVLAVSVKKIKH